jgi:translation initiation factor 1
MDFKFDEEEELLFKKMVTISVKKRNGKKWITFVIGLGKDLDLTKMLSHIKKKYSCNGSIVNDEKYGKVMSVTGDQQKNIYDFLINENINKIDEIILKGV